MNGKVLLCLVLLLCSNMLVAQTRNISIRVDHQQCEYRINPVGIDAKAPRLSWIITASGQNVLQTAWRLIVSDDSSAIRMGKGTVWDSGKRMSDQSIQVLYAGPELQAGKKYYWRVSIWDNKGRSSGWSSIASWQMGLLKPEDWAGARWIAYDSIKNSERIFPAAHGGGKPEWNELKAIQPLLRKEFAVRKKIKQATIFASGLGHFELSLNGKKIGDHFLDPGWNLYSKEAFYVGFDITKQIKQGINAMGVMLGNGFYHVPRERYRKITGTFGHPKFICRMLITYDDGSSESIISDGSWKTTAGPITYSSIFGGEDYNAQLEQKGWKLPGFNDKTWQPALQVEGSPRLVATMMEPLRVMQTFKPVKILQPRPGIFVYDFGQNFSGIPSLTGIGKKGMSVKMIPGEILDSLGLVDQSPSGKPSWFTYTFDSTHVTDWRPRFTYYGFRYIQVEGAVPKGSSNPLSLPVINELQGLHTRNASRSVGTFDCSNPLFNKIFHLIDWSVKSNMASVLTDCPHREKLGWLEVAHLLGNSMRYNYDIASFYQKIVHDMALSQTAIGLVPNIAPEWVQFDPDFRDSPEWGSSAVILPYYLYQWYGDTAVLANSYDMMKRYVQYLGTKAVDHIVSHGLGDWFDIGPNGSGSGYSVSTPQGITGTAIYYYDLNILIKTAQLLNKPEDAVQYENIAKDVKAAFNRRFFNREKQIYGTGSQTANAMAVYMNLVEPEHKQAVIENIVRNIRERNNRLSSGEVGYKYLIAVLEKEGRSDVIYDMNSRSDVPGYGFQIANGATTLMEDWQAKKNLGNNHCMLGHFLGWLYSGLGGIRQADSSVAFKSVIIAPQTTGNIQHANTTYFSPYGEIVSRWKKSSRRFELNVTIPVNTAATLLLPGTAGSMVSVNGKETGTAYFDAAQNKWKFGVGSGTYKIEVVDRVNATAIPALIPMPQKLQWTNADFNISACKTIEIGSEAIRAEATHLQQRLNALGLHMNIVPPGAITNGSRMVLNLENVDAERNKEEAYRLTVNTATVKIAANTQHGIFNAVQTLLQLITPRQQVKGCTITDFPAFAWRGYMVDVGRNYQSTDQLKEQIDVMAKYKLNVFHFHLTEDIAWRLQIKKFPQLTAPEHMQRNKGNFYTVEQVQDIVRYCRQRHITLVPEIDVPGHSGAFKRAMGVDMQSQQGTQWVKEIFEEITTTYDVPYLHIGADEVKITNPTFIAEISGLIRKHKKTVIAWSPGAKYDDAVIRQLWKDEGADELHTQAVRYIDSRALYISDFDPLNSVVTIFNRRIGGKAHGDSALLGAEFCLWNDRNVNNENELLSRNAVYPSMLAFAERSWQGNGYPEITFGIGEAGSPRATSFAAFEQRLLEHKNKYFNKLPFTYVAQMHMRWKLLGPFNNNGNFDSAYWPEQQHSQLLDSISAAIATGGTIWLWHTHSPAVKAWLPSAKDSTTWYAYTQFWSDSSGTLRFWLGTKDISRSGADATPPKHAWDYTASSIWINRNIIPPPTWKFAGQPSGKLDVAMADENFYYRDSTPLPVKKGWNEILVKLPMGKFDPLADWQVPPKWMFTVIPVEDGKGVNLSALPLRYRVNRTE